MGVDVGPIVTPAFAGKVTSPDNICLCKYRFIEFSTILSTNARQKVASNGHTNMMFLL